MAYRITKRQIWGHIKSVGWRSRKRKNIMEGKLLCRKWTELLRCDLPTFVKGPVLSLCLGQPCRQEEQPSRAAGPNLLPHQGTSAFSIWRPQQLKALQRCYRATTTALAQGPGAGLHELNKLLTFSWVHPVSDRNTSTRAGTLGLPCHEATREWSVPVRDLSGAPIWSCSFLADRPVILKTVNSFLWHKW